MGRMRFAIQERLSLRNRRADLPALRDLLGGSPGARLLDIGGGTGRTTAEFTPRDARAIVLEPEGGKLAFGRTRRPSLAFVGGRAEALPFPEGSLDRVVGIVSFHHIERPDVALDEIRRVLRRDGLLVLLELHPDRPGLLPRLFGPHGSGDQPHFYEPERLRTFIEAHGFRSVTIRPGARGYFVTAAK